MKRIDPERPQVRAPVFPGGIAGASLKPRGSPADDRERHHVFPGGIAGASLKRGSGGKDDSPVGGVFPGGIAGASLKRHVVDGDVGHRVLWFSPAESPGPH